LASLFGQQEEARGRSENSPRSRRALFFGSYRYVGLSSKGGAAVFRHFAMVLGAILCLCAFRATHAASLITDPSLLHASDQIDWSSLGIAGSVLSTPLTMDTRNGMPITVNTGGTPPTFKRLSEGNGFVGDFPLGAELLATNSLGATHLHFDTPIVGAGTYIEHLTQTSFTAYVVAMSGTTTIASYTLPVTNHRLEDGSAPFIGILSDSRNITDIYFDSYYGGNTVTSGPLLAVPEPSTLALLAVGAVGLFAFILRRRWQLHNLGPMILAAMVVLAAGSAQADVSNVFNMGGTRDPVTGTWTGSASLEFVTVGDAGNAGEWSGRVCGAVNYNYQMGKFDVTAGQYTEFLNAVAATDTYHLYNTDMVDAMYSWGSGCNIERTGSSGSYVYSVAADWANRPVNFVSWGDAVRFVNWLSNGQPTGAQGLNTTEDGSYYVNGATSSAALMAVKRKANARYVIPTEDEWYKAAYFDPNKPGGAGYWDYPTKSDSEPSNLLLSAGTNNANFLDENGTGNGSYTIGSPYFRTDVGAFASSSGPYGTFDQGGNIWQWNDSTSWSKYHGLRGGSYGYPSSGCIASYYQCFDSPTRETCDVGFRVASVPEPSSLAMLAGGALTALLCRWRKRA
jgi:formylglycine-generating enzyme